MSARRSHLLLLAAVALLAALLVVGQSPELQAVIDRPHVRLWTRLLPGFLLVGLALRRREGPRQAE